MKKIYIFTALVATIIVAGIVAYLLFARSSEPNSPFRSAQPPSTASSNVDACDIATDSIANELLGEDITKSDGSMRSVSTDDIAVSICNYSTKITLSPTSNTPKISGINILARIAKTQNGANSNQAQFQNKPIGIENVSNIADSAYYNPQFRQLNVLKGGNWYIIGYYIDTVTNATLDSNKKLAQKLDFR